MKEKILVVEDDPAALRLRELHPGVCGDQVIQAVNGFQGLRKAQEERPDLLVLDRCFRGSMATRSSPAALQPARSRKPLPILTLTAKSGSGPSRGRTGGR